MAEVMNKILIIEDDPFYTRLYHKILNANKYELLDAKNGEDGIYIALNERPHLILMDWFMPRVDGLTAASYIKSELKDCFIFMMMVTGQSGNASKILSLEFFDDYLEKPFDPGIFLAKVERGMRIVTYFKRIEMLYKHIKELSDEKQSLINEIEKGKTDLEKRVIERTNELDQKNQLLINQNEKIIQDIKIAGKLQHILVPQIPPALDNYEIFCRYMPMETIGGDFYDFISMRENKIAIILGDVSGHGIAAAFITSMVKSIIANNRKYLADPKIFLYNLNNSLVNKMFSNFITIFYMVLSLDGRLLWFASAGHPPPLVYRGDSGIIEELKAEGTIIGAIENMEYGEREFPIRSGDKILLYTDGLLEVFDENKKMFDFDQLKVNFKNLIELNGKDIINNLVNLAKDYSFNKAFDDDTTLILINVK